MKNLQYRIHKTLKEDIWNWQYQLDNHNVFGFDFCDNLGDAAERKFFDSMVGKNHGEREEALQNITGQPLYFTNFTVYITTFPGEPFGMDFDKRELTLFASPRLNSKIGSAIDGLLHEALHGETIYYWRKKVDLSDEQFNDLREAVTVVLDESLVPEIMSELDQGYPAHKKLREKLHAEWVKTHDFDKIVHLGARLIRDGTLVS